MTLDPIEFNRREGEQATQDERNDPQPHAATRSSCHCPANGPIDRCTEAGSVGEGF